MYNLNYTFDENLIEVFEKEDDIKKYIDNFNKEDISIAEKEELSFYFRVLKEYEKSESYLKECIEFYENKENERKVFINKIRLATLFQCKREFEKSDKIYKELFENIYKFPDIEDFLYQHFAKNKFLQNDFVLAINFFERALEIRVIKNDEKLLESTKFALDICREKLKIKS